MLRYWTAGESHGKCLLALIDGFPAGLEIDIAAIDRLMHLRQGGYGRGTRQKLETDKVEVLTGVWQNVTLGSPVTLQVLNADSKLERLKELPRPRPGHGDLSGSIKYLSSMRGILERASARETAGRVAAGALCQQLLAKFGIRALGYVVQLGRELIAPKAGHFDERKNWRDSSAIYSLDPSRDQAICQYIDQARDAGDTLGGIIEVVVEGLPFGLGTHAQWDRKLDGKLAQAVMAVQAIKGVEIGLGFKAATLPGSQVHDPIQYKPDEQSSFNLGYVRPSNHAGGLEAGMTNGQPLVIRAAKKPISTLQKPLESIDMQTKQASTASYERSDVCALSAASIIIENVVAFEIAAAMVDKFGGDSLEEMQARWQLFHHLASKK
jgi:chorismate synthase